MQDNTNKQYTNKWFTFSNIDQHIWYIKYGGSCTDKEMDHFIVAYQNEFTKVNKKSIIFNGLNIEHLSFGQSMKMANMMQDMRNTHIKKLSCFAIVLSNSIIIGILNFIFKLVPPVRPYIVCNNIEEAKKFIKQQNPDIYNPQLYQLDS
jgi:ABC-type polysaccharide transport system permease subunit